MSSVRRDSARDRSTRLGEALSLKKVMQDKVLEKIHQSMQEGGHEAVVDPEDDVTHVLPRITDMGLIIRRSISSLFEVRHQLIL